MTPIDVIAFDADDTLWHNEPLYSEVQERFMQIVAPYCDHCEIHSRLYETEIRNLEHYGYGIKAFMLSLIETAIEVTEARIPAREISQIIMLGRKMLTADIDLLDHVAETIPALAQSYPLMLITKGDLLDQQAKVARSGLGEYFGIVEVVADKTRDIYASLLARHSIEPSRFLMVGNALRSDILPVVVLGGHAVYIPYAATWTHEHVEVPDDERAKFHQIEHVGLLPELLGRIG